MKYTRTLAILIALTFFTGCGKKDKVTENKTDSNKIDVSQQVQTKPETTVPQTQPDTLKKPAGEKKTEKVTIKAVADEKKFLNDPKGQWPYDADVSSTRANLSDDFDAGYSNIKLIGKPDVDAYGDNKSAWTPKDPDKGLEWFKVSFEKPVYATEIRIRQTCNPGTITRIELIDENGQSHVIWEGSDNNEYPKDKIRYFVASFKKADFKSKTVKVTIESDRVKGWDEFDAVQLVGE